MLDASELLLTDCPCIISPPTSDTPHEHLELDPLPLLHLLTGASPALLKLARVIVYHVQEWGTDPLRTRRMIRCARELQNEGRDWTGYECGLRITLLHAWAARCRGALLHVYSYESVDSYSGRATETRHLRPFSQHSEGGGLAVDDVDVHVANARFRRSSRRSPPKNERSPWAQWEGRIEVDSPISDDSSAWPTKPTAPDPAEELARLLESSLPMRGVVFEAVVQLLWVCREGLAEGVSAGQECKTGEAKKGDTRVAGVEEVEGVLQQAIFDRLGGLADQILRAGDVVDKVGGGGRVGGTIVRLVTIYDVPKPTG